ncbi:DUF5412 family protein [Halalkalibacter akibai]|uniref:DUF5412 family protein n=1 Tax=Halalkalibacter akibai TaxID=1411 RepID=UPI000AC290AD|nr:DUF5412 family protein [Halalkalibacter akibai]
MVIIPYLNLFGLLILFSTVVLFFIFSIKLLIYLINKKQFPKKLMIASFVGITLLGIFTAYTIYCFTFQTADGEFYKGPVTSPTEEYTANAYYMTYGGAAGGVNVWVEIINNLTEQEAKIVYYSDAKSKFSMRWQDDKTLYIENEELENLDENKSIELNVEKEIYHDQGLACRSWLMKDQYESCFSREYVKKGI